MDRIMAKANAFFHKDSSAGLTLMFAAVLAMLASNSFLAPYYTGFLSTKITIGVGELVISKGLILWINDGLMAIFFFLVGMEIKREILVGDLSSFDKALLPLLAAIGGMAGPALIFAALNFGHTEMIDGQSVPTITGWAIPAATDIAFALGILALLGSRAPVSLKILLLAIAIIDDLGAIIIIAAFYSEDISLFTLGLAGAGFLLAVALNLFRVNRPTPYVLIAIFVWVCVLKSGVHATLAGVMIALTIPLRDIRGEQPLLPKLEHDLHLWVSFMILPIFAFANAGVNLSGLTFDMLLAPLPLGVAAGLFFGKQIGVFGITWLIARAGIARAPEGVNWGQIYGLACLCGVGFTMSLFIGGLAFRQEALMDATKLGVLMGSISSGILGFVVLFLSGSRKPAAVAETAH